MTIGHPSLELQRPICRKSPVLIDSPHSGRAYPIDFNFAIEFEVLRMAEDLFVDHLYADGPLYGATFLQALFPRSYIDLNRPLSEPLSREGKSQETSSMEGSIANGKDELGMGLVWQKLLTKAIYSTPPTELDIKRRIEHCYLPYRQALKQELDRLFAQFGKVLHLNVHSMADKSPEFLKLPVAPLADIVLGDMGGSTCRKETTELIADMFRSEGFSVAINDPFKGVSLIQDFSNPDMNRESIQIEIKRSLYCDQATHQRNEGFQGVRESLNRVVRGLCEKKANVASELDELIAM
jgi:N-formylglutamate deformylase